MRSSVSGERILCRRLLTSYVEGRSPLSSTRRQIRMFLFQWKRNSGTLRGNREQTLRFVSAVGNVFENFVVKNSIESVFSSEIRDEIDVIKSTNDSSFILLTQICQYDSIERQREPKNKLSHGPVEVLLEDFLLMEMSRPSDTLKINHLFKPRRTATIDIKQLSQF